MFLFFLSTHYKGWKGWAFTPVYTQSMWKGERKGSFQVALKLWDAPSRPQMLSIKKKKKEKEKRETKSEGQRVCIQGDEDPEQDCVKQLGSKAFTGHTHIGHASALPAGSGHTEQGRWQTSSLAEKGRGSKFFCAQYLTAKALAQDLRHCFHLFVCLRRWREDTHLIPPPGHPCCQLVILEVCRWAVRTLTQKLPYVE